METFTGRGGRRAANLRFRAVGRIIWYILVRARVKIGLFLSHFLPGLSNGAGSVYLGGYRDDGNIGDGVDRTALDLGNLLALSDGDKERV